MFPHRQNDTRELAARKPAALLKADRVQPDFGTIGIAFDMHMRRLGTVSREKEEPVRPNTEDGWHGEQ